MNPARRSLFVSLVALAVAAGASACGESPEAAAAVTMVSYTPDGSPVLFSAAGIDVYDQLLKTRIRRISTGQVALPAAASQSLYSLSADGTTAAIASTPKQETLAVYGNQSRAGVFRIRDGALLKAFQIRDATDPTDQLSMLELALSPDGRLLFASTETYGARSMVLDATTGAELWAQDGWWSHPIWSADGTTLFATEMDLSHSLATSLDALDPTTGALKWRSVLLTYPGGDVTEATGTRLTGLALVGDGTSLMGSGATVYGSCSLGCGASFPFWSAATGNLTGELPPQQFVSDPLIYWQFACNASDTCVVDMEEQEQLPLRVFKTDGTTLLTAANGNWESPVVSPDGNFVVITDYGEQAQLTLRVLSVPDGTIVGSRSFPPLE
ncbi:MAG TPA: hypothetical protein VMT03_24680 [Polyangia bacterium]|nr:hypothetical protein [Polyangia bacterium]